MILEETDVIDYLRNLTAEELASIILQATFSHGEDRLIAKLILEDAGDQMP